MLQVAHAQDRGSRATPARKRGAARSRARRHLRGDGPRTTGRAHHPAARRRSSRAAANRRRAAARSRMPHARNLSATSPTTARHAPYVGAKRSSYTTAAYGSGPERAGRAATPGGVVACRRPRAPRRPGDTPRLPRPASRRCPRVLPRVLRRDGARSMGADGTRVVTIVLRTGPFERTIPRDRLTVLAADERAAGSSLRSL